MKKLCVFCVALIAAAVLFHSAPVKTLAKGEKFFRSSRPVPNRYIVALEDTSEFRKDPVSKIADLNRDYPGSIDKVYSYALDGYSVEMTEAQAQRLSADSRVKYVEEDGYVSQSDVEPNPGWGLDRIDQHTMPLDLTYNFSGSGSGVNIYILDSGILTSHVDFQGRAIDAYDAVHDSTPISQCNGHGTGVAGVAGGSTVGVAKQALIYSVRVLPCTGYGTVSDVVSGIDWVTRHAVHPAVANMSLETTYSKSVNDALSASIASGVTYVVAAGNDGGNACGYSPSSLPEAITVGATSSIDERVTWSNFGACVDLFAPGEGVATIWNTSNTTTTWASGTSFSSPYVAGVAALYLEQNPSASPLQVQAAIVANATSGMVVNAGTDSPNLMLYSQTGPPPPPSGCSGVPFSGSIGSPGGTDYQSSTSGFAGGSGVYSANLQEPDGAAFSLYLEKKNKSRWSSVASAGSGMSISYNGKSGTYRWRIASISGSGNYSLCAATP